VISLGTRGRVGGLALRALAGASLLLTAMACTDTASDSGSGEQASQVAEPATTDAVSEPSSEPAAIPVDPPLDVPAQDALALAETAMSQGRPDAVAGLLQQILDRETVPSRVLFVAGWAAYQLLHYEDSVQLMGRALTQDPELLADSRVLAFGHHKLGDFDRAAELFAAITEVAPREYRAWYGLGLAELSRGEYGPAQEHLERCLSDRPDYLKARYTLARMFEESGRPELALPEVTDVLDTEPSHVEALYLLSRVQAALGLSAEAEATVARWRLAYTVRERLGPLRQRVINGQASPELFLEMASQFALLEDRTQQGRALQDGLRRFPEHMGLRMAMASLAEGVR